MEMKKRMRYATGPGKGKDGGKVDKHASAVTIASECQLCSWPPQFRLLASLVLWVWLWPRHKTLWSYSYTRQDSLLVSFEIKMWQRNMQIKVLIEMNTEHQSFPIKNGLYLIVAITSFYNNYKAKTPGQEGRALQGSSPVKLRFHLLISILGPSPLLWP